ncbi:MAG: hypothetical protein Q8L56_12635 [Rhodocyclaceae bacterium]|nr:hypothetical protein [Rhodocyclaceae bacterium]
MTFSRKLIAVLAVLCLFGAQQAAFAHWASHLGAPAVAGLESQDGEHAAAAVIDRTCSSCAAFSGLCAALPGAGNVFPATTASVAPAPPAPRGKSVPTIRRYDSRAPPYVL